MGTTMNYGIPYPELTDPPDGAGQIKALAQAVDGLLFGRVPGLSGKSFTTTTWPCPNNAWTDIAWQNGGTQFVCPVKGIYLMGGTGTFAGNNTGSRGLAFAVDGGAITPTAGGTVAITAASSSQLAFPTACAQLNAGQIITARAFQSSGAPLAFGYTAGYTSGIWILCLPN